VARRAILEASWERIEKELLGLAKRAKLMGSGAPQ
jgi:hypothetical protein